MINSFYVQSGFEIIIFLSLVMGIIFEKHIAKFERKLFKKIKMLICN